MSSNTSELDSVSAGRDRVASRPDFARRELQRLFEENGSN